MKTRLLIGICPLLFMLACAATREAKVEGESGFLGTDYGLLKEGGDDQAQLVYYNPSVDFAAYRKIWLAPVRVIRSEGSKLAKYSKEDLQKIADATYSTFAEELASRWQLVRQPEPGTLKIEPAITDVDRSEPVMDTIVSIIPQTRTLTTVGGLVTGKAAFVGGASGEAKITDAQSGELLGAGMDRRVGTRNLSGMTDSWNDFDQSLQFWAKRLAYNLCLKQGVTDCGEAPRA